MRLYADEGIAIQQDVLGGFIGAFTTDVGALSTYTSLWGYAGHGEREERRAAPARGGRGQHGRGVRKAHRASGALLRHPRAGRRARVGRLHTAFQDGTPMILLVGQIRRADAGREAFQELDYPHVLGAAHEVGGAGRPGRAAA